MEHHSNIVPWNIVAQISGLSIKYVKVNSDGSLNYQDFEGKLSRRTKVVSLTHVSNVTGAINDIKEITKTVHDFGALVMVDGAQSVPHLPVDVWDLDIDFLAFSGHKMLGPTGIGVLYGKAAILDRMEPFQGGGSMIDNVSLDPKQQLCNITYNALPTKFEAGTPDISGSIGLGAAVEYLQTLGMEKVQNHEKILAEYALQKLGELSKVTVYGHKNKTQSSGIIAFNIEGFSSHDVALLMDSKGIAIRSGFHCAEPLHHIMQLQSSARASFYIYNTYEEIDRFIDTLKQVA